MFILKFHIPSPIDWTTSQVANVIALIAAIATVGALWYAMWQGRKNSKKINDLAEITKQLADQNKLIVEQNDLLIEQNNLQKLVMKNEVRPNLSPWSSSINGSAGTLEFEIINKGKRATLTTIEYNEQNVVFIKKEVPILLQSENVVKFNASTRGSILISDCDWSLIVHFNDVYGNKYQFFISGKGSNYLKNGTTE